MPITTFWTNNTMVVEDYKVAWASFVKFILKQPKSAELVSYSAQTGQSYRSVQRKAWAITYAGTCELSADDIIALGPSQILSQYSQWLKELREPRKNVTMGVRLSQKPLLEAQIERLKELLGSKERPATTELVTDWLCSHLEQLSDSQIRNEAQGVG